MHLKSLPAKNLALFLLFSTAVSTLSPTIGHAQEAANVATQKSPEEQYVPAHDDPYTPHAVLESGKHAGDPVPDTFRRSIQILSRDEKNETITVANFMHNNEFHIATIPLNGIEDLIYQIDYFNGSVPAAHTEIRVRFKDNARIIIAPQYTSKVGVEKTISIREMVFSIEAVKQVSNAFTLIAGLGKNYAIAYRFMSVKDKYADLVGFCKERVTQYKLNISDEDKKKWLTNAIELSDKKGLNTFYNTWENNCTTEQIRLLDKTLHYPLWRGIIKQSTVIGSHYPIWIRASLKTRGILGEELPNFNADPSVDMTETEVDSDSATST